jgi:peptide deformylase
VILKIVQVGDPVLRAAARALTRQEILSAETQQLIRDMRETMYAAPGVGLAAPQIGQSLQLAVIEDSEDNLEEVPPNDLIEKQRSPVPFHVIINPVITHLAEEKANFYEGCLSLAGFSAVVPRARSIRVEYLDERGK